jgi:hypothetical protein
MRTGNPPSLVRRRAGGVVALLGALAVLWAWHGPDAPAGDKKAASKKKTTLPGSLALVPSDAAGVISIRVADLWDSDPVKALRQRFLRKWAGLRLRDFPVLSPADIESVTVVLPSLDSFDYAFWGIAGEAPRAEKGEAVKPAEKPSRPPEAKKKEQPAPEPALPLADEQARGGEKARPDVPAPPLIIVTAVKPVDQDRLVKAIKLDGQAKKYKGKTYYAGREGIPWTFALHFANRRTCVLTGEAELRKLLDRPARAEAKGVVARALKLAAQKHQFVVGIQVAGKTAEGFRQMWDTRMMEHYPTRPIARALRPLVHLRSLTASLDLGKESRAELRLGFANEAEAGKATIAARDGLTLLRIFTLDALQSATDEQLADTDNDKAQEAAMFGRLLSEKLMTALRSARVEQSGSAVSVTLRADTDAQALAKKVGAALKAWKGDKGAILARNRRKVKNCLSQIGIAMHAHNDAYQRLPANAIYDKNGKPLLSWRVAILPFIEQVPLYKQFKLDEPWDSEHNKKLLARMPSIYAPVGVKDAPPNSTYYQLFTGNGTPFVGMAAPRIPASFPDGTSNTILAVEASKAVPWTKPEDIVYDPKKPPKLGAMFPDRFAALMVDGRVEFIKKSLDPKVLDLLINPADGLPLPANVFD